MAVGSEGKLHEVGGNIFARVTDAIRRVCMIMRSEGLGIARIGGVKPSPTDIICQAVMFQCR